MSKKILFSHALYQATLAVNASSNTKYIILTDSLSSVQSIQYVYPSNPLVIKIKQEVHTAQLNGKIIIFLWIPSHIGIQGNEEADNAAKEAATSDSAECTETFTSADVKAAVKRKVRYMWEEKWKVSSAKLREIKKSIKPWPTLPTSRRDQVILTRLRLGHTRLTNSHVFSYKQEPRCDNCEEKLTIKHLLENCAALTPKRILYNIPNKLSDILGLQCNMSNLKRFLSAINILYNI
ncbi:uncharacterized protein LOC126891791 [Diabrotica virgifera virgifera]|uniref:RNase H type-1 domain-containing protein n=1 Tax=Diabrotica virgifera virgifera TaxID=50390 RepID=A0ABM5JMC7_DIAVI|nr:uncharacterized protein LOC126879844 [Diabrotica virgifera virgifera]XP_050500382.1 uncharacterized protein LOC126880522 [Diabrotica virgifera virgifera]XP_050501463.1 uncharacterized protein LOC126881303 [Diabrotica virgifera virgifera]XP_050502009.1 uncharacterized protein LOC126881663 [Diabrotica virgifera virgifera]XP_050503861.1 uncharacterized protein LOC126882815 [Diabrotica virgifera virgifera]XP_050517025.1 uncharacterized protein LOC126891791 [Diabrotica virgifera virgifera]